MGLICPKCLNTTNITRERSPMGWTECLNCGLKAKSKDWDNLKFNQEPIKRTIQILEINALEKLTPQNEGVELNEGYEYVVNGSIPQLADGIAKMAIEMDKQNDLGENAGLAFLTLITQYYERLKSE